MSFRAHIIVPLIMVAMPLVLSVLFGEDFSEWHNRVARVLGFSPMLIFLGLFLLLPIGPALLLNQTRIVLLLAILTTLFYLTASHPPKLSPPVQGLLVVVLAIQTVWLTYLRERGLFTRYGLLRVLIALGPLVLLAIFNDSFTHGLLLIGKKAGWLLAAPAHMHTPYAALLVVLAAFVMLWRLRGTEYPLIAPAFAGVLLSALMGIEANSDIWSDIPASVARAVNFSVAGMLLLWSVYLLSWGRAYRDELTGLPGRRALEEKLAKLSGTYTLVMADVDHFKKFNDRYGHDVGDDVLRMVGKIFSRFGCGVAYRYGGEEFTLVVPGSEPKEILDELDRLREEIAATHLTIRKTRNKKGKTSGQKKVTVTASFGAAGKTPKRRDPLEVLKAADRALYKAKNAGRNRVWAL